MQTIGNSWQVLHNSISALGLQYDPSSLILLLSTRANYSKHASLDNLFTVAHLEKEEEMVG